MCVVFTLNRSFYPMTSVHPVSVLIDPREILIMWSQTDREKPKQPQLMEVRQVKCYRTWYENTAKQARPDQKHEKNNN